MKRKSTIACRAARATMTLLMIVVATTAWCQTKQFPTESGGLGTSTTPYLIKTVDDLNKLSADVNSGTSYSGEYFQLDNDININSNPNTGWDDANSTENNFTPIGTSSNEPFSGHFDGNGYKIYGLRIYSTGDCKGLFGYVKDGELTRVFLDNAIIGGKNRVGGIVGSNDGGTIERCAVNYVAIHLTENYGQDLGGIVGHNTGTVNSCTSYAQISILSGITGNKNYGGIVGYNGNGTVTKNYAIDATVPAASNEGRSHGAIIGFNGNNTTVTGNYYRDCTVAGTEHATNVGISGSDVDGARALLLVALGSGITATGGTTQRVDNYDYYPSGSVLTLSGGLDNLAAPANGYRKGYTTTAGTVSYNGGSFTLTLDGGDATVTATNQFLIDWAEENTGADTDNAYRIYNTEQLDLMAQRVNNGTNYQGKYFKLMNNIAYDANQENNFTAIGNNVNCFNGHFDGGGHVISGIRINKANVDFQGLFGCIAQVEISGTNYKGEVSGVIVVNAKITGHEYVGCIAGYNNGGTLTNNYYLDCTVTTATTTATTGIGCNGADIATNNGACSLHTLTLDGNIGTTTPPTVTIDGTSYYSVGTEVTVSGGLQYPTEFYLYPYRLLSAGVDDEHVGATFDMPARNVTVKAGVKMAGDSYDLSKATAEGLKSSYKYTGNAISLGDYTVKTVHGDVINPVYYTAVIKNSDDDEVPSLTDVGNYLLVITPSYESPFSGTFEHSFRVEFFEGFVGWCGNPTVNGGQNVYYKMAETAGEKTLTICKNPDVAEGSDFSMEDYEYDNKKENCNFAPWMEVTPTTTLGQIYYNAACDINHLVIEEGVTSIGNYAFQNCMNLPSVNIPNSVTSIGKNAFCDCYALSSITVPSSLTRIGSLAFDYTAWLSNQPDGVVYLGNFAYLGKNVSGTVEIQEGMVGIADAAFGGCTDITSIIIPDGVKYIGARAFWRCENLPSVSIPSSVTSIGTNAFGGCKNLSSVSIPDGVTSIEEGTFQQCKNLKSVSIAPSVTSIGDYAFILCENLSSVSIPPSVTSIGKQAFRYCTSLETVICYAPYNAFMSTPTFGQYAFDDNAEGRKIYVPNLYPWDPYQDAIITPIPNTQVTVATEGYATYYNRLVDVELPAGMKACIVTATDGTNLTYVTIADGDGDGTTVKKTVPAGTAVVLKVAAGTTPGGLTPKTTYVDTRDFSETNLLHGSDIDAMTTGSGKHYKLAYGLDGTGYANELAWYWGADGGAPFLSPAHKAWLVVPDNSNARPCFGLMEASTTGIDDLKDGNGEESLASKASRPDQDAWFTLDGRRLDVKPTAKGVYVNKHRVVVVK